MKRQPLCGGIFGVVMQNDQVSVLDDINGLLRAFGRYKWLFWSSFTAVFLSGFVYVLNIPETFKGRAVMVLDVGSEGAVSGVASPVADTSAIETDVAVITSSEILERVVLSLGEDDELSVHGVDESSSEQEIQAAIFRLRRKLRVYRDGLTYTVHIVFEADTPRAAAAIPNLVAETFLNAKRLNSSGLDRWLSERTEELRAELVAAEAALDAYRSQTGIVAAKGETLSEADVRAVDTSLREGREDLRTLEAQLSAYRSAVDDEDALEAASIVNSTLMDQLRLDLSTLRNERAQLASTLGEQHPTMVELRQRLSEVELQIDAEARRVISELSADTQIARSRVARLESSLNASRNALQDEKSASIELSQLQSSVDTLRSLYQASLARFEQVSALKTLDTLGGRIISPAVPPSRADGPGVIVLLGAVGAAAALVGFGAVLVRYLTDDALWDVGAVEQQLGLPCYALVPRLGRLELRVAGRQMNPEVAFTRLPGSVFAEAFRELSLRVGDRSEIDESLIIQVTSTTSGEGKTVCSSALAQAFAAKGYATLLVDFDTRRPTLTRRLTIVPEKGVLDVIIHDVDPADAILNVEPLGIDILPMVEAYELEAKLSIEKLKVAMNRLRSNYRVIIVDSGPVMVLSSALAMAQCCDEVVLAVRWNKTPRKAAEASVHRLQSMGAALRGIVISQVNLKAVHSYSYGKQYHRLLSAYFSDELKSRRKAFERVESRR